MAQQQPVAAAGFKRSRALWDKALRVSHPTWTLAVRSYLQAVLYEVQPLRWSQWTRDVGRPLQRQVAQLGQSLSYHVGKEEGREQIRQACRRVGDFVGSISRRHWMYLGGAAVYYSLVRWIHGQWELGPVVLMTSALIAIFTIGLDDDNNRDGVSAYAVFNRGFQRLLGSVNEQDLLAQHVGGGGMMMNLMAAGRGNDQEIPDWNPAQEEEEEEEEDSDQENVPRPGLRRRRPRPAPRQENDEPEHGPGGEQANRPPPQQQQPPPVRRRGKKGRRRANLEQRQELRRQRDAARAMGFQEPPQQADQQQADQQDWEEWQLVNQAALEQLHPAAHELEQWREQEEEEDDEQEGMGEMELNDADEPTEEEEVGVEDVNP